MEYNENIQHIIVYGGGIMATKSILKNVTIREKNIGRKFVNALSKSKDAGCQNVELKKKCTELKSDDILKMFGDK